MLTALNSLSETGKRYDDRIIETDTGFYHPSRTPDFAHRAACIRGFTGKP